jgi:MFS family permease
VDLPAGFLADRVGYGRLSRLSVVLLIAASVVGAVSPGVEWLIVSRIGSGIAVGILATVILAALSSTATVVNRGKVMSLFHVANNTGIALYPMIGGFVGLLIGWRATFAVTAVLAVIGGLILLPLLGRMTFPTRKGGARKDQIDERRVLHGRRRTVAVLVTNYGVVANMIHRHGFRNTILPLYAATALGLGGVSIATAIALMSITGLVVATPGGMLGDRIGRRRVITAGLAAVAAGDLAFILTNDLALFLLVAALIGLGDFFTSSQTALLSEVVPPEDRTRSLSQYRFSADLGALIGPVLLAFVMDRSSSTAAILVAAGILVSASVLAWLGVPGDPTDEPASQPAHA